MTSNISRRIASIDVLRALTMLLMIFVNDLWSLTNIPQWLEHTAAQEDGMGLADVVFPAFLFIVGMSIPLAVQVRKEKGDNTFELIRHILERSVALLVMGIFLVNGESINESGTGLSRVAWNMLSCICFIAIWNSWPKTMNTWLRRSIKASAIFGLVILAWFYRGGNDDHLELFAPQWWGILGLIGWAYLVSAIIYVLGRGNTWAMLTAWIVLLGLSMISHSGAMPENAILRTILGPIGDGALAAFTMGGILATTLLQQFRRSGKNIQLYIWFAVIAILLLAIGFYLRPHWGISKIRATPSWVLICSGITMAFFIPVYWLTDQLGKKHWFKIIEPAGNNTLVCYLLPYFAYGIMVTFHLQYPSFLLNGALGLLKSFIFSLLMIIIAGWLGRRGLRLKL